MSSLLPCVALCYVHAPSLVTEKAREGGTGENTAVLYGQQAYSASVSHFFFLSFLPLLQKEVDAEIIPEKSKINVMRKRPLWKTPCSPAVCKCEPLSNWAAARV